MEVVLTREGYNHVVETEETSDHPSNVPECDTDARAWTRT